MASILRGPSVALPAQTSLLVSASPRETRLGPVLWKDYLVDLAVVVHKVDLQALADVVRQVGEVLPVLSRQNDAGHPSPPCLYRAKRSQRACACVCVCEVCTYSYSFLFDPSHWEDFARQGNFARHGHVLAYWPVGCERQERRNDGAASAGSVFGRGSLETSRRREE